jgi:integrase
MPPVQRKPRARQRGEIAQLQSGSYRVRVYVGRDPITKKRHYLQETVRKGPGAADEAEKTLRRLLVEVDDQLNPRTSATVRQLLEQHFKLLEVERTTRATYENLARTHIVPLIGKVKLAALTSQVFDSFYAELTFPRRHGLVGCGGQAAPAAGVWVRS